MSTSVAEPLDERRRQLFGETLDHETLLVRRGQRSGVPVIIAVNSTVLGPALGGCRMWSYATLADAIRDALRLSAAMTLKAAVADLPLGGGKAVICLPPGAAHPAGPLREAILRDLADAIEMLDGGYVTAEDVGTHAQDMALLSEWTPHAVGRPEQAGGGGDPGAFTAAGVQAAIHACCEAALGSRSLRGRSVSIVGVGSVGSALARRLKAAGAELLLADVDATKRELALALAARWASPREALRADVDVLAPCALGGVIDDQLAEELRCRIVCGAANNQLASDDLAERIAERGILYAPDFVVNAAGLINASLELTGYDAEEAQRRAAGIERVLTGVLERARAEGHTPLQAAFAVAEERLTRAS
jgi:leucine dehydrogenase